MKPAAIWLLAALAFATVKASAAQMPYVDQDFACVTQQQAQKYVSDFRVDVSSFGGLELCDSNVDTKKLFNDLQIIEQGQFAANASNNLIKGYVPADRYYSWMKSQTRGMNRGNDVPYATAYNSWGYFTMQDGWAKLSTLGRVGTVIHEARHTAGYRHYPCSQGPYMGANLDGCDVNYAQAGSHAIEMEYYARVTVAGENFHPVYQSMARLMAMGRTNFVFNSSPIQKREAVLAIEDHYGPMLFENNKKIQREGSDFVGRLKRTSFGAALFDGIQAVALELYEINGAHPSIKDDYSYFKLLGMESIGALKDFEEFDRNQKRFVAAVTESNKLYMYNFPRGTWNSPRQLQMNVDRTATTLPTGEQGYFLISNGDIYNVDSNTQQVTSMGKKWDEQIQSVALLDGKTLVLKNDGIIYQRQADGTEAAFDSGTFTQMVNVPLYDAFEVK